MIAVDPPLDPSPDGARSLLRRELLKPEYNEENLIQRMLTWLERQVNRGIESAGDAPPLRTFATMVIVILLVVALVWLLSQARRTARTREVKRAVLTEEVVTAAQLRSRAEVALAQGRHEDALVDGFRALAVRQVERGRLDDTPGATAHEVAMALASTFPHQRPRVDGSAVLFDSVLYGDRPASHDQASGVLALDDELAGLR